MRKLSMTLGILVLIGVLAVPVFAWHSGGWGGWMHGPGHFWQGGAQYGDLTEDQRNELDKLEQKFYDDTAKLRSETWTKSEEFDAELNRSDLDTKKVKALQKEISDLKAKMAEQMVDFELKARKIAPSTGYARGYGRGYGRHMRGYGPHRGGYGPGSCGN